MKYRLDPTTQKLVPVVRAESTVPVDAGQLSRSNAYPYLSVALDPEKTVGAETVRDPRTGGQRVLIESARHEREVAAINGLEKDGSHVEDGTQREWTPLVPQPEWEEDWGRFYGYGEGDWAKYFL
jgi:hypothetical protein